MRVIVISVLLFISVVVGDEGGVAMNPAEEAGIGETVDSVKEEGISVAINPAEESGVGETVDPAEEAQIRNIKRPCPGPRSRPPGQTSAVICKVWPNPRQPGQTRP